MRDVKLLQCEGQCLRSVCFRLLMCNQHLVTKEDHLGS